MTNKEKTEQDILNGIADWLRGAIWIPKYGDKGKKSHGPEIFAEKILQSGHDSPHRRQRLNWLRGILGEALFVELLQDTVPDLGRASLAPNDVDQAGCDIVIIPTDSEDIFGGFDIKSSQRGSEKSGLHMRGEIPLYLDIPAGYENVDNWVPNNNDPLSFREYLDTFYARFQHWVNNSFPHDIGRNR